jgi:preprotein translocase subunit SecD
VSLPGDAPNPSSRKRFWLMSVPFRSHPYVSLEFGKEGGDLLFELTKANSPPDGDSSSFKRCLAIIVNRRIMSAPGLYEPIKSKAVISGGFSGKELETLVEGLKQDIATKKK